MNIQERLQRYSTSIEQLSKFRTVREVITGTAGLALAVGVSDKVIMNLNNFRDYRELAQKEPVPYGVGKTYGIQFIKAKPYQGWTEGNALSAQDPTVATKAVTLAPIGDSTLISDLLANTSPISFVEKIARAHAAGVRMGYVDKITDEMAGASTGLNTVTVGVKGDATETSLTFDNFASCIAENLADGYVPDFLATGPDKFWKAATTSYAVTQFTGAMADFLMSGKAPVIMGLDVYTDPYFELAINAGTAWTGADTDVYALIGTKGVSAGCGQLQDEPEVEINRLVNGLSNYIITHVDFGATEGFEDSICRIKHAA